MAKKSSKFIKKNLKWILLLLLLIIILNYKKIPGYHQYLMNESYQVTCTDKRVNGNFLNHVPCKTLLNCTRKKMEEFCSPNRWEAGTKCDYNCSIRFFCLEGYCRSNSYMNTIFLWWITLIFISDNTIYLNPKFNLLFHHNSSNVQH